jgi:hypothetical protein
VHEQQDAGAPWSLAADGAYARTLLDAISADPSTVLAGSTNADIARLVDGM